MNRISKESNVPKSIPVDYQKLGERIHFYRRQWGFTQQALAKNVGISASFLGHIERGSRKASIETLCGIAQELRTGIDALLFDTQERNIFAQNEHSCIAEIKRTMQLFGYIE